MTIDGGRSTANDTLLVIGDDGTDETFAYTPNAVDSGTLSLTSGSLTTYTITDVEGLALNARGAAADALQVTLAANNAVITGVKNDYPSGNFFPADTAAVQFLNFASGDYHLSSGSPYKNAGTDGKDVGADIDAILRAYAGGTVPAKPSPLGAFTVQ